MSAREHAKGMAERTAFEQQKYGGKPDQQQRKAVGEPGRGFQKGRDDPAPTRVYGANPGDQGQNGEAKAIAIGKLPGQRGEQIAAPDGVLLVQQKRKCADCGK